MTRLLTAVFVLLLASLSFGQGRAVIVVGAPGSPMYQRHYDDRTGRFEAVLNKAGLEVTTVSNRPADDVLAALTRAAGEAKKDEQFVLVVLGHGSVSELGSTLATPGKDLSFARVGEALSGVKSRSQVVLNFAACSGDAMQHLVQPGRVNIASSGPQQVNDNDFVEFVLQELEANPRSPLLDVYNHAVEKWAKWTVRQKSAEGGGWSVEGKESAALFKKLYGGADVPADRRFTPTADADKADEPDPPLLPEPKPHWTGRRVVTEHPTIDDTAKGAPASALGEKGFVPVKPAADQPNGAVAAKTVLGTP